MRLNYERRGSGSPLVLLHGVGHRWQAWLPVLDALAQRHEVIAVDLPGFGHSTADPGQRYDMPSSMARLQRVLEELGVHRPHLAGNSLGALLAVEGAARGLAASATALAPAGFWSPRERARTLRMLRRMALGAHVPSALSTAALGVAPVRRAMLRTLYAHPERIDRATAAGDSAAMRTAAGLRPTLRAGRHYSWHGTPPTVPVTVAWGTRDRVLRPRQARRAAELLPDARHVLLPGCGHVPMVDDPRLVAATILDTCALAEHRAAEETAST